MQFRSLEKTLKLGLAVLPPVLCVWLNAMPVLADCAPAAADGVTAVCSGETVDQNAPNGFGTGIENGVTVEVRSGASVTGTNGGIFLGSDTTLDNAGSITGVEAAVVAEGSLDMVSSGTVSAAKFGVAAGTLTSLTNTGTISAGGIGVLPDLVVSLTNAGTISGGSTGIRADAILHLSNSGTITGGDVGISVDDNVSLTNDGSISGGSDGVTAGTIVSVTNRGSISGGDRGIAANSISNLINAGSIIGSGGVAIQESGVGGDTRLTLLPGSVIVGGIDLGGGVNTLEVGKGLNLAATFEGAAPVIGGSGGAPVVVVGNQVIVVDPTGLAAAEVWLDSLANSILNTVDANAASGGGLAGSRSADGGGAGGTDGPTQSHPAGSEQRVWGSLLGGYRSQEGDGANVDLDLAYGGALLGADAFRRGGLTLGAFLGGAISEADQEFDAQDIDATSAFGGFYLRQDWEPAWINLTLAGGWVGQDSERRVANNLAADGIDEARAEYDGYFVIPAVTLGARIEEVLPSFSLEPSLRLHYAGLFLEGFEESGSVAALRVQSRELHQAGARAQLALPYLIRSLDGEVFRLEGRLGLDGRLDLGGDRVNARVAGLPLDLEASFEDEVVSGFLGAGVSFTTPDGSTVIGASAEGRLGSDGSSELGGKLAAELRLIF